MDRPKSVYLLLLLVLAVALAYANSVDVDFVYDDHAFVRHNEAIRTFTPLSKFLLSPEAFSQPVSYHVYRPLASFTFAVNYALNGLQPAGYHVVNLLFHTLNVLLVFLVLGRLGFRAEASFVGALVFAVHPIHTEAVTWISGRGNVLFLFFFLLAYLLYVQADSCSAGKRVLVISGAVLSYGASLLAKEMALPLPVLLFAHDVYFCPEQDWRPRRLWRYLPFVLAAAAFILLRSSVLGRLGQVEYHGGSAYSTFLAMPRAFVIYGRLLLVPVGLSLSRHFQPVYSLLNAAVLPSLCLVALATVAAVFAFRRAPLLSFALVWFGVTMLPVSNVIPVNALVADRFLYGPSICFSIIIASLVSRTNVKSRKTLTAAALAAVVFFHMTLSVGRNNDWKHAHMLWLKTAKSSPTSFVAFNNLGFEYMKRGRIVEAVEALREALRLKGDLTEAHLNLAKCYERLGRLAEAESHYSTAIALAPDNPEAYYQLGLLYRAQGDLSRAAQVLRSGLRQSPRHAPSRALLEQVERVDKNSDVKAR